MQFPGECPVCRTRLAWTFMLRPAWSQWRCDVCESLLAINAKRRFLLLVPYLIAIALSVLAARQLRIEPIWGIVTAGAVGLIVIVLQPARVLERCGLRCKGCGYDLRGQVATRCPECGRELDGNERHFLATGTFPRPQRRGLGKGWALLLICVLIALALSVAFGLYKTTRLNPPIPVTPPGPQPQAARGG